MMERPQPGETAMIVKIDIEGTVIDVTYANGTPAEKGWPFKDERKPLFKKNLFGHAVFAYEMNPTCVTYQTPGGARTV